MAHGFEVVVLTAYAKALLGVRCAGELGGGIAKEDVLELVHTCVGEHEGRVILDNHWSAGHHGVALGGKKVQILLADFFRSHIVCFVFSL